MPIGNKRRPNPAGIRRPGRRGLFVTGTDTGAGKTLLTALLLEFLRGQGVPVAAFKPFCSGGTGDARVLARLQRGALTLDQIAPFRFAAPLAPLVAARLERRTVLSTQAIEFVESMRPPAGWMLIEGCGGLMTPLAEGFSVLDWIAAIGCPVAVAARNRLGVINHVRLSVDALQSRRAPIASVVLMGCRRPDYSAPTNPRMLEEILDPLSILEIPYLGPKPLEPESLAAQAKKFQKTLARALRFGMVPPSFRRDRAEKRLTETADRVD